MKHIPGRLDGEEAMPIFTWAQLERQLERLAEAPERSALARPMIRALRSRSRLKPSELVLQEILCLAWALLDEAFLPGPRPGEEAEMP